MALRQVSQRRAERTSSDASEQHVADRAVVGELARNFFWQDECPLLAAIIVYVGDGLSFHLS